ncbi:MAG TPA: cyclase family protein, partial [Alphaproteobacteria bacterium]|nr:cyclase family protein [Alphaproteobacteria bacterium]
FNHNVYIDYADCQGEDKFRVMKVGMHAGIGTHMDAPSHCIPGGRFIHDFDVNDLIMPCVVIDVSGKCHERYSLSVQDIGDIDIIAVVQDPLLAQDQLEKIGIQYRGEYNIPFKVLSQKRLYRHAV